MFDQEITKDLYSVITTSFVAGGVLFGFFTFFLTTLFYESKSYLDR